MTPTPAIPSSLPPSKLPLASLLHLSVLFLHQTFLIHHLSYKVFPRYSHFSNVLNFFRNDLSEFTGGQELPFIDAKINPDREVWQYGPEVNEQKEKFAALSENNILIDTVEEGLHTDQEPAIDADKCHYDTESEVKLGNLFAEAFEPFLEPVK